MKKLSVKQYGIVVGLSLAFLAITLVSELIYLSRPTAFALAIVVIIGIVFGGIFCVRDESVKHE